MLKLYTYAPNSRGLETLQRYVYSLKNDIKDEVQPVCKKAHQHSRDSKSDYEGRAG